MIGGWLITHPQLMRLNGRLYICRANQFLAVPGAIKLETSDVE